MKNFTKKYQVWTYGDLAYTCTEFDTLQECIEAPKYSDWYITKKVSLNITDAEEQLNVGKQLFNPNYLTGSAKPETVNQVAGTNSGTTELTDEQLAESDMAAKYVGGSVGKIY